MSIRSRWVVMAWFVVAAPSALAQSYRCSANGATYYSDRPCATAATRTQLGGYGPARSAATPTPTPTHLPDAPRMQEHVHYLGSGCASISEAIRTAPARGVRGDVVRELHDEYAKKCTLEDQDARAQLQRERAREQQSQLAQRDGAKVAQQQASLRADQCGAMRDVVALKRKREAELNGTEVQALRELEKSYNQRCLAR